MTMAAEIGADPNSKLSSACWTPLSKTRKFFKVRSDTYSPFASRTTTGVLTNSTLTRMEGLSGLSCLSCAFWAPKAGTSPNGIWREKQAAVKTMTPNEARAAIFISGRFTTFIIGGDPRIFKETLIHQIHDTIPPREFETLTTWPVDHGSQASSHVAQCEIRS